MDPNETLRQFRRAIAGVHLAEGDGDDAAWTENAAWALEMALALDDWMSRGGALPKGWQR